jgi:enoyl-CoA hydratase/carnithine racemase
MAELKRFEFSALRLDHLDDGRLALLTLDRPKARNAINRGMATISAKRARRSRQWRAVRSEP